MSTLNIVQGIQKVAKYIQSSFSKDKCYLQYKSSTAPEEYDVYTPDIYCFTIPSTDLKDTYPARCPCICLTLDGRNDSVYDVTAHLCISNVSLSDSEMAKPVGNGVFEISPKEEYDTNGDSDLLIESILFTDQFYNYISNYKELEVSDISVGYTEVDLPDYPYAVSTVSFKLNINISEIGQNPYSEYY